MFEDKKDLPYTDIPEPTPQEEDFVSAPPLPGGIAPQNAPEGYEEDFSVSEKEFQEMAEGSYSGRLVSLESTKSKAGNKMYVWTYVITKGENQGKEMINHTALTPNAMWKLKETLVALGVKPVDGVYNFVPSDVLNKDVTLDIELQEYEGQSRPSISKVLPPR